MPTDTPAYHTDATCGSCNGPLEVDRDAICHTCAPDKPLGFLGTPAPRFWREVPTIEGCYWDGCKLYDLYRGCWWRDQRCIGELEWNDQCWFFGPLPEAIPEGDCNANE